LFRFTNAQIKKEELKIAKKWSWAGPYTTPWCAATGSALIETFIVARKSYTPLIVARFGRPAHPLKARRFEIHAMDQD
jgi:hypothetical protein